jgi:hypothetical protein
VRLSLGPSLQRRAAGVRQAVDAALRAIEPAIDVMQQNLGGVGDGGLEIARALRGASDRRR